MADKRKPRSVSGEIMTGTSAVPAARVPADDIVDAEFETVESAGPAEIVSQHTPAFASANAPPAGMEILRAAEASAESRKPVRGGPIFWTFGIGLAAAAFWVSGGHALVRSVALLGQQQARSALTITAVTSRVDASGAKAVLLVDGEASNDGGSGEILPPLEIAVTGNDGLVTRYRLGTSNKPMAPGEKFAFSSRLDVPKNGVKTVSVTFGE